MKVFRQTAPLSSGGSPIAHALPATTMLMNLPALLFLFLGMAISGPGNRLLWVASTVIWLGLTWLIFNTVQATDTPQTSFWLSFAALMWMILCPMASLVSAWLLRKYHPLAL
jgi:hypothetical protein